MRIGRNSIARLGSVALATALGACSSVPTHFYTLAQGGGATPAASSQSYAIEVLPVAIPAQVSVPQFVVRDSAQSVLVLEQERWSAPLQDEIRGAIAQRLSASLGAVDSSRISGANLPAYRVRIDIQRFDAWLGQSVGVDAVWSLTAPSTAAVAIACPTQISRSASSGYPGLVQAYQQALDGLSDQIASAVRALESQQKIGCASIAQAR